MHTHTHTYIYIIQNYITYAPTCFGASAPSSEKLYIFFAKVIVIFKVNKINKTLGQIVNIKQ